MRVVAIFLTSFLATATAACGRDYGAVQANVTCKGAEAVVHCDVVETHGLAPLRACWDLAYVCANGKKASGSYCQEVQDGKTVPYEIEVTSIKGIDGCDVIDTMDVQHFKLTVH